MPPVGCPLSKREELGKMDGDVMWPTGRYLILKWNIPHTTRIIPLVKLGNIGYIDMHRSGSVGIYQFTSPGLLEELCEPTGYSNLIYIYYSCIASYTSPLQRDYVGPQPDMKKPVYAAAFYDALNLV